MELETQKKLSTTSIVMHWLVGISMIMLFAVGTYMERNEYIPILYYMHKSIGTILFFVILYRIYWRFKLGWPPAASQYKKYEHILSKIVHWVLLLSTILFPISGLIMSGYGGYGIFIFELNLIAPNIDPSSGYAIPFNSMLADAGHTVHSTLAKIIIAAFILHLVGALKHHFIDKDNTLKRMLGK